MNSLFFNIYTTYQKYEVIKSDNKATEALNNFPETAVSSLNINE